MSQNPSRPTNPERGVEPSSEPLLPTTQPNPNVNLMRPSSIIPFVPATAPPLTSGFVPTRFRAQSSRHSQVQSSQTEPISGLNLTQVGVNPTGLSYTTAQINLEPCEPVSGQPMSSGFSGQDQVRPARPSMLLTTLRAPVFDQAQARFPETSYSGQVTTVRPLGSTTSETPYSGQSRSLSLPLQPSYVQDQVRPARPTGSSILRTPNQAQVIPQEPFYPQGQVTPVRPLGSVTSEAPYSGQSRSSSLPPQLIYVQVRPTGLPIIITPVFDQAQVRQPEAFYSHSQVTPVRSMGSTISEASYSGQSSSLPPQPSYVQDQMRPARPTCLPIIRATTVIDQAQVTQPEPFYPHGQVTTVRPLGLTTSEAPYSGQSSSLPPPPSSTLIPLRPVRPSGPQVSGMPPTQVRSIRPTESQQLIRPKPPPSCSYRPLSSGAAHPGQPLQPIPPPTLASSEPIPDQPLISSSSSAGSGSAEPSSSLPTSSGSSVPSHQIPGSHWTGIAPNPYQVPLNPQPIPSHYIPWRFDFVPQKKQMWRLDVPEKKPKTSKKSKNAPPTETSGEQQVKCSKAKKPKEPKTPKTGRDSAGKGEKAGLSKKRKQSKVPTPKTPKSKDLPSEASKLVIKPIEPSGSTLRDPACSSTTSLPHAALSNLPRASSSGVSMSLGNLSQTASSDFPRASNSNVTMSLGSLSQAASSDLPRASNSGVTISLGSSFQASLSDLPKASNSGVSMSLGSSFQASLSDLPRASNNAVTMSLGSSFQVSLSDFPRASSSGVSSMSLGSLSQVSSSDPSKSSEPSSAILSYIPPVPEFHHCPIYPARFAQRPRPVEVPQVQSLPPTGPIDFEPQDEQSTSITHIDPLLLEPSTSSHRPLLIIPTQRIDTGEHSKSSKAPNEDTAKDQSGSIDYELGDRFLGPNSMTSKSTEEQSMILVETQMPKKTTKDPPKTSTTKDPPKTSTTKDPSKTSTTKDPPKTSTTKDPPKTFTTKDPSKTSTTKDLPKTFTTKDPPKTSASKKKISSDDRKAQSVPPRILRSLKDESESQFSESSENSSACSKMVTRGSKRRKGEVRLSKMDGAELETLKIAYEVYMERLNRVPFDDYIASLPYTPPEKPKSETPKVIPKYTMPFDAWIEKMLKFDQSSYRKESLKDYLARVKPTIKYRRSRSLPGEVRTRDFKRKQKRSKKVVKFAPYAEQFEINPNIRRSSFDTLWRHREKIAVSAESWLPTRQTDLRKGFLVEKKTWNDDDELCKPWNREEPVQPENTWVPLKLDDTDEKRDYEKEEDEELKKAGIRYMRDFNDSQLEEKAFMALTAQFYRKFKWHLLAEEFKDKTEKYKKSLMEHERRYYQSIILAEVGSEDSETSHKDSTKKDDQSIKDSKTSHKDSKTSHKDTKTSHKDSKTSRKDSKMSHKDSKTSHKETKTSHKDSKTSCKDSKTSHKDSKTSHKNSKTSHKDSTKDDQSIKDPEREWNEFVSERKGKLKFRSESCPSERVCNWKRTRVYQEFQVWKTMQRAQSLKSQLEIQKTDSETRRLKRSRSLPNEIIRSLKVSTWSGYPKFRMFNSKWIRKICRRKDRKTLKNLIEFDSNWRKLKKILLHFTKDWKAKDLRVKDVKSVDSEPECLIEESEEDYSNSKPKSLSKRGKLSKDSKKARRANSKLWTDSRLRGFQAYKLKMFPGYVEKLPIEVSKQFLGKALKDLRIRDLKVRIVKEPKPKDGCEWVWNKNWNKDYHHQMTRFRTYRKPKSRLGWARWIISDLMNQIIVEDSKPKDLKTPKVKKVRFSLYKPKKISDQVSDSSKKDTEKKLKSILKRSISTQVKTWKNSKDEPEFWKDQLRDLKKGNLYRSIWRKILDEKNKCALKWFRNTFKVWNIVVYFGEDEKKQKKVKRRRKRKKPKSQTEKRRLLLKYNNSAIIRRKVILEIKGDPDEEEIIEEENEEDNDEFFVYYRPKFLKFAEEIKGSRKIDEINEEPLKSSNDEIRKLIKTDETPKEQLEKSSIEIRDELMSGDSLKKPKEPLEKKISEGLMDEKSKYQPKKESIRKVKFSMKDTIFYDPDDEDDSKKNDEEEEEEEDQVIPPEEFESRLIERFKAIKLGDRFLAEIEEGKVTEPMAFTDQVDLYRRIDGMHFAVEMKVKRLVFINEPNYEVIPGKASPSQLDLELGIHSRYPRVVLDLKHLLIMVRQLGTTRYRIYPGPEDTPDKQVIEFVLFLSKYYHSANHLAWLERMFYGLMSPRTPEPEVFAVRDGQEYQVSNLVPRDSEFRKPLVWTVDSVPDPAAFCKFDYGENSFYNEDFTKGPERFSCHSPVLNMMEHATPGIYLVFTSNYPHHTRVHLQLVLLHKMFYTFTLHWPEWLNVDDFVPMAADWKYQLMKDNWQMPKNLMWQPPESTGHLRIEERLKESDKPKALIGSLSPEIVGTVAMVNSLAVPGLPGMEPEEQVLPGKPMRSNIPEFHWQHKSQNIPPKVSKDQRMEMFNKILDDLSSCLKKRSYKKTEAKINNVSWEVVLGRPKQTFVELEEGEIPRLDVEQWAREMHKNPRDGTFTPNHLLVFLHNLKIIQSLPRGSTELQLAHKHINSMLTSITPNDRECALKFLDLICLQKKKDPKSPLFQYIELAPLGKRLIETTVPSGLYAPISSRLRSIYQELIWILNKPIWFGSVGQKKLGTKLDELVSKLKLLSPTEQSGAYSCINLHLKSSKCTDNQKNILCKLKARFLLEIFNLQEEDLKQAMFCHNSKMLKVIIQSLDLKLKQQELWVVLGKIGQMAKIVSPHEIGYALMMLNVMKANSDRINMVKRIILEKSDQPLLFEKSQDVAVFFKDLNSLVHGSIKSGDKIEALCNAVKLLKPADKIKVMMTINQAIQRKSSFKAHWTQLVNFKRLIFSQASSNISNSISQDLKMFLLSVELMMFRTSVSLPQLNEVCFRASLLKLEDRKHALELINHRIAQPNLKFKERLVYIRLKLLNTFDPLFSQVWIGFNEIIVEIEQVLLLPVKFELLHSKLFSLCSKACELTFVQQLGLMVLMKRFLDKKINATEEYKKRLHYLKLSLLKWMKEQKYKLSSDMSRDFEMVLRVLSNEYELEMSTEEIKKELETVCLEAMTLEPKKRLHALFTLYHLLQVKMSSSEQKKRLVIFTSAFLKRITSEIPKTQDSQDSSLNLKGSFDQIVTQDLSKDDNLKTEQLNEVSQDPNVISNDLALIYKDINNVIDLSPQSDRLTFMYTQVCNKAKQLTPDDRKQLFAYMDQLLESSDLTDVSRFRLCCLKRLVLKTVPEISTSQVDNLNLNLAHALHDLDCLLTLPFNSRDSVAKFKSVCFRAKSLGHSDRAKLWTSMNQHLDSQNLPVDFKWLLEQLKNAVFNLQEQESLRSKNTESSSNSIAIEPKSSKEQESLRSKNTESSSNSIAIEPKSSKEQESLQSKNIESSSNSIAIEPKHSKELNVLEKLQVFNRWLLTGSCVQQQKDLRVKKRSKGSFTVHHLNCLLKHLALIAVQPNVKVLHNLMCSVPLEGSTDNSFLKTMVRLLRTMFDVLPKEEMGLSPEKIKPFVKVFRTCMNLRYWKKVQVLGLRYVFHQVQALSPLNQNRAYKLINSAIRCSGLPLRQKLLFTLEDIFHKVQELSLKSRISITKGINEMKALPMSKQLNNSDKLDQLFLMANNLTPEDRIKLGMYLECVINSWDQSANLQDTNQNILDSKDLSEEKFLDLSKDTEVDLKSIQRLISLPPKKYVAMLKKLRLKAKSFTRQDKEKTLLFLKHVLKAKKLALQRKKQLSSLKTIAQKSHNLSIVIRGLHYLMSLPPNAFSVKLQALCIKVRNLPTKDKRRFRSLINQAFKSKDLSVKEKDQLLGLKGLICAVMFLNPESMSLLLTPTLAERFKQMYLQVKKLTLKEKIGIFKMLDTFPLVKDLNLKRAFCSKAAVKTPKACIIEDINKLMTLPPKSKKLIPMLNKVYLKAKVLPIDERNHVLSLINRALRAKHLPLILKKRLFKISKMIIKDRLSMSRDVALVLEEMNKIWSLPPLSTEFESKFQAVFLKTKALPFQDKAKVIELINQTLTTSKMVSEQKDKLILFKDKLLTEISMSNLTIEEINCLLELSSESKNLPLILKTLGIRAKELPDEEKTKVVESVKRALKTMEEKNGSAHSENSFQKTNSLSSILKSVNIILDLPSNSKKLTPKIDELCRIVKTLTPRDKTNALKFMNLAQRTLNPNKNMSYERRNRFFNLRRLLLENMFPEKRIFGVCDLNIILRDLSKTMIPLPPRIPPADSKDFLSLLKFLAKAKELGDNPQKQAFWLKMVYYKVATFTAQDKKEAVKFWIQTLNSDVPLEHKTRLLELQNSFITSLALLPSYVSKPPDSFIRSKARAFQSVIQKVKSLSPKDHQHALKLIHNALKATFVPPNRRKLLLKLKTIFLMVEPLQLKDDTYETLNCILKQLVYALNLSPEEQTFELNVLFLKIKALPPNSKVQVVKLINLFLKKTNQNSTHRELLLTLKSIVSKTIPTGKPFEYANLHLMLRDLAKIDSLPVSSKERDLRCQVLSLQIKALSPRDRTLALKLMHELPQREETLGPNYLKLLSKLKVQFLKADQTEFENFQNLNLMLKLFNQACTLPKDSPEMVSALQTLVYKAKSLTPKSREQTIKLIDLFSQRETLTSGQKEQLLMFKTLFFEEHSLESQKPSFTLKHLYFYLRCLMKAFALPSRSETKVLIVNALISKVNELSSESKEEALRILDQVTKSKVIPEKHRQQFIRHRSMLRMLFNRTFQASLELRMLIENFKCLVKGELLLSSRAFQFKIRELALYIMGLPYSEQAEAFRLLKQVQVSKRREVNEKHRNLAYELVKQIKIICNESIKGKRELPVILPMLSKVPEKSILKNSKVVEKDLETSQNTDKSEFYKKRVNFEDSSPKTPKNEKPTHKTPLKSCLKPSKNLIKKASKNPKILLRNLSREPRNPAFARFRLLIQKFNQLVKSNSLSVTSKIQALKYIDHGLWLQKEILRERLETLSEDIPKTMGLMSEVDCECNAKCEFRPYLARLLIATDPKDLELDPVDYARFHGIRLKGLMAREKLWHAIRWAWFNKDRVGDPLVEMELPRPEWPIITGKFKEMWSDFKTYKQFENGMLTFNDGDQSQTELAIVPWVDNEDQLQPEVMVEPLFVVNDEGELQELMVVDQDNKILGVIVEPHQFALDQGEEIHQLVVVQDEIAIEEEVVIESKPEVQQQEKQSKSKSTKRKRTKKDKTESESSPVVDEEEKVRMKFDPNDPYGLGWDDQRLGEEADKWHSQLLTRHYLAQNEHKLRAKMPRIKCTAAHCGQVDHQFVCLAQQPYCSISCIENAKKNSLDQKCLNCEEVVNWRDTGHWITGQPEAHSLRIRVFCGPRCHQEADRWQLVCRTCRGSFSQDVLEMKPWGYVFCSFKCSIPYRLVQVDQLVRCLNCLHFLTYESYVYEFLYRNLNTEPIRDLTTLALKCANSMPPPSGYWEIGVPVDRSEELPRKVPLAFCSIKCKLTLHSKEKRLNSCLVCDSTLLNHSQRAVPILASSQEVFLCDSNECWQIYCIMFSPMIRCHYSQCSMVKSETDMLLMVDWRKKFYYCSYACLVKHESNQPKDPFSKFFEKSDSKLPMSEWLEKPIDCKSGVRKVCFTCGGPFWHRAGKKVQFCSKSCLQHWANHRKGLSEELESISMLMSQLKRCGKNRGKQSHREIRWRRKSPFAGVRRPVEVGTQWPLPVPESNCASTSTRGDIPHFGPVFIPIPTFIPIECDIYNPIVISTLSYDVLEVFLRYSLPPNRSNSSALSVTSRFELQERFRELSAVLPQIPMVTSSGQLRTPEEAVRDLVSFPQRNVFDIRDQSESQQQSAVKTESTFEISKEPKIQEVSTATIQTQELQSRMINQKVITEEVQQQPFIQQSMISQEVSSVPMEQTYSTAQAQYQQPQQSTSYESQNKPTQVLDSRQQSSEFQEVLKVPEQLYSTIEQQQQYSQPEIPQSIVAQQESNVFHETSAVSVAQFDSHHSSSVAQTDQVAPEVNPQFRVTLEQVFAQPQVAYQPAYMPFQYSQYPIFGQFSRYQKSGMMPQFRAPSQVTPQYVPSQSLWHSTQRMSGYPLQPVSFSGTSWPSSQQRPTYSSSSILAQTSQPTHEQQGIRSQVLLPVKQDQEEMTEKHEVPLEIKQEEEDQFDRSLALPLTTEKHGASMEIKEEEEEEQQLDRSLALPLTTVQQVVSKEIKQQEDEEQLNRSLALPLTTEQQGVPMEIKQEEEEEQRDLLSAPPLSQSSVYTYPSQPVGFSGTSWPSSQQPLTYSSSSILAQASQPLQKQQEIRSQALLPVRQEDQEETTKRQVVPMMIKLEVEEEEEQLDCLPTSAYIPSQYLPHSTQPMIGYPPQQVCSSGTSSCQQLPTDSSPSILLQTTQPPQEQQEIRSQAPREIKQEGGSLVPAPLPPPVYIQDPYPRCTEAPSYYQPLMRPAQESMYPMVSPYPPQMQFQAYHQPSMRYQIMQPPYPMPSQQQQPQTGYPFSTQQFSPAKFARMSETSALPVQYQYLSEILPVIRQTGQQQQVPPGTFPMVLTDQPGASVEMLGDSSQAPVKPQQQPGLISQSQPGVLPVIRQAGPQQHQVPLGTFPGVLTGQPGASVEIMGESTEVPVRPQQQPGSISQPQPGILSVMQTDLQQQVPPVTFPGVLTDQPGVSVEIMGESTEVLVRPQQQPGSISQSQPGILPVMQTGLQQQVPPGTFPGVLTGQPEASVEMMSESVQVPVRPQQQPGLISQSQPRVPHQQHQEQRLEPPKKRYRLHVLPDN